MDWIAGLLCLAGIGTLISAGDNLIRWGICRDQRGTVIDQFKLEYGDEALNTAQHESCIAWAAQHVDRRQRRGLDYLFEVEGGPDFSVHIVEYSFGGIARRTLYCDLTEKLGERVPLLLNPRRLDDPHYGTRRELLRRSLAGFGSGLGLVAGGIGLFILSNR